MISKLIRFIRRVLERLISIVLLADLMSILHPTTSKLPRERIACGFIQHQVRYITFRHESKDSWAFGVPRIGFQRRRAYEIAAEIQPHGELDKTFTLRLLVFLAPFDFVWEA
jgi:hypothetical protein